MKSQNRAVAPAQFEEVLENDVEDEEDDSIHEDEAVEDNDDAIDYNEVDDETGEPLQVDEFGRDDEEAEEVNNSSSAAVTVSAAAVADAALATVLIDSKQRAGVSSSSAPSSSTSLSSSSPASASGKKQSKSIQSQSAPAAAAPSVPATTVTAPEVSSSATNKPTKSSAPSLERQNSDGKNVKLRLNEDGEVDFRASWKDSWHQRVLLIINFTFLLLGFTLLYVGIYAMRTNPVDFLSQTMLFQAIASLGFFIVLISALGCWGAYYEKRWLLVLYCVILFLLLVSELAIGLSIFMQRSHATEYVSQAWSALPNELRVRVQNQFGCCGLLSFNDTIAGVPCPAGSMVGGVNVPVGVAGGPSCLPLMLNAAESISSTVGAIAIAFASCQLAATILVIVLLVKLKHLRQQQEMHAAELLSPVKP